MRYKNCKAVNMTIEVYGNYKKYLDLASRPGGAIRFAASRPISL